MTANTAYRWRAAQGGFSLVELAVALVIMGVIGIAAWRWVASTRAPLERSALIGQLAQAQAAVEGFILAQHRLPCATASTDGLEQCSNAGASAVLLPWRTLGLSSRFGQLHYGVNRGGGFDLASLPSALASPDLGIDFGPAIPVLALSTEAAVNTAADAVTAAIAAAQFRRSQVNGLDWCRVVRQFAAHPDPQAAGALTVGNTKDSMAVAFVIAHHGVNGVFEGHNVLHGASGWRFDFPGRAQDHTFDDVSVAAGPSDLSARLGCVARLGAMQAAAQGAFTAYDNARVVQEYWALRVFDITQAESALGSAETGVTMAAMNLALATTSGALSTASAANTEGVTAFGTFMALANITAAGAELVLAIEDVEEATDLLKASKAKEKAFRDYVTRIYGDFTQALNAAVRLDKKELNP